MRLGPLSNPFTIVAQVPIFVSGYGLPQNEGAETLSRRIYSLGNHVIADVPVLYFEDVPACGVAGFLFAGKLYRAMAEVDQAVAEHAVSMLIERWNQ